MQNDNKTNIADKINDFIRKNRKGIFIVTGVVVFLFAGLVIFLSLQDVFRKRAISEVEELNRRFEDLRYNIGNDYTGDMETLLADLNAFAKNRSGFAGSRAWSIIAQIHYGREELPLAEEAWLNAARTGDKTYLAPMALFNAAAVVEEQGKIEQAIELLEKCVSHSFEFPAAPRAQFSIGRLYEKLNNYPAAVEAYRAVFINWPDITIWQNLARSRITAIDLR